MDKFDLSGMTSLSKYHSSQGKISKAVIHKFSALDVREVRAKVGMTQNEFTSTFGIGVSKLRHWERGDRSPQGPALALLNVVAKELQVVLNALKAQSKNQIA